MNSISEKTIEELAMWAKANENRSVFPEIQKESASYYMDRSQNETYLMEYSFRNMLQLKRELTLYNGLEADMRLLERLIIEVCKNRSCERKEKDAEEGGRSENMDMAKRKDEKTHDSQKTLPEYVYVF